MKIIYCTCNVNIKDIMLDILNNNNVLDYQLFEPVLANSENADPRFNNAVWPGYNIAVLIQSPDDEKTNMLFENIKNHNNTCMNRNEFITFCSWKMENFLSNNLN